MGNQEKAKLDDHLASIRALENKLMQTSSGNGSAIQSCAGLTKPTDSSSSHPAIANDLLHMDILVNALACDITRVGVIQFGSDQALQVDLPNLQGDQHGGFIHSGAAENFKSRPEVARALQGFEARGFRHSNTLHTTLLFVATPVVSGGINRGVVRITYPASFYERQIYKSWAELVVVGVLVMGVVTALSIHHARVVTSPS